MHPMASDASDFLFVDGGHDIQRRPAATKDESTARKREMPRVNGRGMTLPAMSDEALLEEALTRSVIGAFFEVYNRLDFGLLEHVYVMALEIELRERGHVVAREVSVPIFYRGRELTWQRLDMVVDGRLVVETKSTRTLHPTALRQLYSYLRATRLEVGLLLHFGPSAKFHRVTSPNDTTRGK